MSTLCLINAASVEIFEDGEIEARGSPCKTMPRSEQDVDHSIRLQRRANERLRINLLHITARRALHNPDITRREFAELSMQGLTVIIVIVTRTGDFYGSANVVDDTTNRIRVLNECGDTVAVEDEKTEGSKDNEPACD